MLTMLWCALVGGPLDGSTIELSEFAIRPVLRIYVGPNQWVEYRRCCWERDRRVRYEFVAIGTDSDGW